MNFGGDLKCNKCGDEFAKISSMEVHYNWRNDIDNRDNLLCPYCPQLFSQRSSLNRHLYGKICPYIKHTQPTWEVALRDLCGKI